MPTTVTKLIKASGGDYSTPQAWEDACPANLVTSDQIWQGLVSGLFSQTTTVVNIAGVTTDATRYVELTCNTGEQFTGVLRGGSSTCASLRTSGSYTTGRTVIVDTNYTRISKLELIASGNAATLQCTAATSPPTFDLDRCLIEGSSGAPVVNLFGTGHVIRNTLVVQRGSAKASVVSIGSGASAYNCTLVALSSVTAATTVIAASYGLNAVKNCALFGGTNVKTGSSTTTFTTCYTDVASPPSGCTTVTYAGQFVNTAGSTRDFTLASGSALKDVGTTDATNAALDIFGTARPQGSAYDVGCFELLAASGVVKTIVGLARASIKTLNGLAIASVKTANGLAP